MKIQLSGGVTEINHPGFSKINATQVFGAGLTLVATLRPDLIPLIDAASNPEVQQAAVVAIGLVTQGVTMVLRTFFTGRAA